MTWTGIYWSTSEQLRAFAGMFLTDTTSVVMTNPATAHSAPHNQRRVSTFTATVARTLHHMIFQRFTAPDVQFEPVVINITRAQAEAFVREAEELVEQHEEV